MISNSLWSIAMLEEDHTSMAESGKTGFCKLYADVFSLCQARNPVGGQLFCVPYFAVFTSLGKKPN